MKTAIPLSKEKKTLWQPVVAVTFYNIESAGYVKKIKSPSTKYELGFLLFGSHNSAICILLFELIFYLSRTPPSLLARSLCHIDLFSFIISTAEQWPWFLFAEKRKYIMQKINAIPHRLRVVYTERGTRRLTVLSTCQQKNSAAYSEN